MAPDSYLAQPDAAACAAGMPLPAGFVDGVLIAAVVLVGLASYGLSLRAGRARQPGLPAVVLGLVVGFPGLLQVLAAAAGIPVLGIYSCGGPMLLKAGAVAGILLVCLGLLRMLAARRLDRGLMFGVFAATLLTLTVFLQTFYSREVVVPCCAHYAQIAALAS